MIFQIEVHGAVNKVAFNEFRSWAGRRYIDGVEYHSPIIYEHLTLKRASREQARACACAICRADYDEMTTPQLDRLRILLNMEGIRSMLFLKVKRANRIEAETLDEARMVEGKLDAYSEILEDTFRIEGAGK
jgi:hypothetical protein